MGIWDDDYTGAGNGDVGPGQGGGRPPGIPDDWEYDPLQGVWVPPTSVIGAPVQEPLPDTGGVGDDTRSIEDGPGPAPAPNTLGGLGLGQPGTLTAPFTDTYSRPTPNALPSVPGLTLPGFKAPDPFRQTTAEDVYGDTGYKFSRDEGLTGVQQSAAARGLLNSGGTLKDIAKWGTDFAGTRFADVDSRRRNDYMMNYQTQTLDPYRFAYQSALDSYAPQLTGYTTNAANTQHLNDQDQASSWNQFMFGFDKFRDQRDSTWNKASQVLMA